MAYQKLPRFRNASHCLSNALPTSSQVTDDTGVILVLLLVCHPLQPVCDPWRLLRRILAFS